MIPYTIDLYRMMRFGMTKVKGTREFPWKDAVTVFSEAARRVAGSRLSVEE
jgi:hypothetical protein